MEDPSFIFTTGKIELKEEGENFFAEGYLSTSELDLVNDIVTKECLLDMAEQMKSRTIKMDVEHESFRGRTDLEREINKTIIPVAKVDDFLVDEKGLKIRTILNKHSQRFEEVKNSIKDGFLDAFSIAFIPIKSRTVIKDGEEVRMLDKINVLNAAYTGNPVNTGSSMTKVFAKSLEFLEEKVKPKKPKPQPDPHKENEDDEDEDEEKKKKKEEEKNHNHVNDINKSNMGVKNMTEEEEKKKLEEEEVAKKAEAEEKAEEKDNPGEGDGEGEPKEPEEPAEPTEPTEPAKPEGEEKDFEQLKADMVEVKAALKRPLLKSKVEQVNKAGIVEEKSLNPLDVIA